MMSGEMIRVPYRELDEFTESVLTKLGIRPEDARTVVEVLSQANLRGVDTHAIDLLPGYVQRIRDGMVNRNPRIKVIRESTVGMVIDADQALGQVSTTFGMQQAINKAQSSGAGWVHVINSNHNGALAYYARMAAEQHMIGVATTTTIACMAPWGSLEPLLGNNLIAIALPCHHHDPLVLDIAFSQHVDGRVSLDKEAASLLAGARIGNPAQNRLSLGMLPFWQFVQHIEDFVDPAPLFGCFRIHIAKSTPYA